MSSDAIARLAAIPMFEGLPHSALRELAGCCVPRRAMRGETIFREGDRGETLYVIDAGAVKVSSLSSDGREVVIAVLGPGDVLGELALLDSGVRSADATAMEDSTLLGLSNEVLRPYLESHPKVALHLLGLLAARLRDTDRALQDVIFNDVPGRLAKRLLDLGERYGRRRADGVLIDLSLTQESLGQMVGSARESVNKALSSFASRGWITMDDRKYLIRDEEALRRRAS